MTEISVVMPARNAQATITTALRSTLRALPADAEVLVLDDASTDETAGEVLSVKDRRVRLLRESSPIGVANALNGLVEVARGRCIARMDADDVTLPGRFSAQLQALSRGSDIVFGARVDFGRAALRRRPQAWHRLDHADIEWLLAVENPVAHSTMLATADVLKRAGPNPYRPGAAEDYDLWLRLAVRGASFASVRRPVIAYRVHSAQVTKQQDWVRRYVDDRNLSVVHGAHMRKLGWAGGDPWSSMHGGADTNVSITDVERFFRESEGLSHSVRPWVRRRVLTAVLETARYFRSHANARP